MTDVREKMEELLCAWCPHNDCVRQTKAGICQSGNKFIKSFLAIPELLIKDDDQNLPEGVGECMDCLDSYKMQNENWVKVKEK